MQVVAIDAGEDFALAPNTQSFAAASLQGLGLQMIFS
jgi:hypothetical protein